MATAGNEIELTHYCELPYTIGQFTDKVQLVILPSITNFDVILGLPWMRKVNPLIPNWQTGDMFLTKRQSNGKQITYKCKAVHTAPFENPLNRPQVRPPSKAQLNRLCKTPGL